MVTGSVAPPVSTEAVICPLASTLTIATANTPFPEAPARFTIPVFPTVAASATMSGLGVVEADSKSVLRPDTTDAEAAFAQL